MSEEFNEEVDTPAPQRIFTAIDQRLRTKQNDHNHLGFRSVFQLVMDLSDSKCFCDPEAQPAASYRRTFLSKTTEVFYLYGTDASTSWDKRHCELIYVLDRTAIEVNCRDCFTSPEAVWRMLEPVVLEEWESSERFYVECVPFATPCDDELTDIGCLGNQPRPLDLVGVSLFGTHTPGVPDNFHSYKQFTYVGDNRGAAQSGRPIVPKALQQRIRCHFRPI